MKREEVQRRILEIGLIPVIRARSAEEAVFAAEAVSREGISIVEVTMTVPGAVRAIEEIRRRGNGIVFGAGTVLNREAAKQCVHASAEFLVSPGFSAKTVDFATKNGIPIIAGAMTPTEILASWEAGADFVKVFPCSQIGGARYIKAIRGPLPEIPFVPTGGVNLNTIEQFIFAGAAALGVGSELVRSDFLEARNAEGVESMAAQFVELVRKARKQSAHPNADIINGRRERRKRELRKGISS